MASRIARMDFDEVVGTVLLCFFYLLAKENDLEELLELLLGGREMWFLAGQHGMEG
jgi:hypothetical protein